MCKFKNLKQFEDSQSNLVTRYDEFEMRTLDLPKENQVWVVKINMDKYGIDVASEIFESIKKQYPDVPMVGIASNIDICTMDIDFLTSELEKMRYKK